MTDASSDEPTTGHTERVIAVAADTLGEDSALFTLATVPADIAAWDSLAQLNIIMSLEDEFGVTFTSSDIESMTSIAAIIERVGRRVGAG